MMMKLKHCRAVLAISLLPGVFSTEVRSEITTPVEQFGFNIGDDYQLASYRQLADYWKRLEKESGRIRLEVIGRSTEGRPLLMAIVTSPANHEKLERFKTISRQLALAEGISEEQALTLAAEGRAVVWIDGGLHATEVLGAQQLIELVFQMASRNDAETLRFLDDVILLVACANPDGMDLVADWYLREPDPEKRSIRHLPRLYQKYVGHDNNRDFYLVSQAETEAISRVLYKEWFPQIGYNHHQTGPRGTVLFAPPFRDPFNYNLHPLVPLGVQLVGAAMHNRFVAEGKPGATMRSGAGYSTWWNGGLRTTQYFHNIIGLLTETIGSPNPIEIPLVLRRQLPSGDLPDPVPPQKWHFRQSIEYSITADRAVLDVASRYRETFLFNVYRMGRNSIERGSSDHWTVTPARLADLEARAKSESDEGDALPVRYYREFLQTADNRDPRGYIIPSDQPDFLTAIKFVNSLLKTGITIHRATRGFDIGGKQYPEGSLVVKCAQAYRPHILDMFEPQDHPNDFRYPGGPPVAPYDSAGWTLAYQMGIQFDRVLDGFDGPFEEIVTLLEPESGTVDAGDGARTYCLGPERNDAFRAVNRLLASGLPVYRAPGDLRVPAGTFLIQDDSQGSAGPEIQRLASELGLDFSALEGGLPVERVRLRRVRVGLVDRYGGYISSVWTRWILEQFEFPYDVVFPPRLDQGDLEKDFDVLIFTGRMPDPSAEARSSPDESEFPAGIPEEFRAQWGRLTTDRTIPQLRAFLEDGGTILAVGEASKIAYLLDLPVRDPLVETQADGSEKPLGEGKFYVPGSILSNHVDNTHPLAYGMAAGVDVYFNNSPVFRLQPEAGLRGVRPVAWFKDQEPLRSGWAWGQQHLQDAVTVLEARVGRGRLFLYGPEILFRAQPHGTFKLLFNGILLGSAEASDYREAPE